MKYSCYYIIHLGWLMGFTMHFYIIFGTNLLTQSPVPVSIFLLVSVFHRKGISNGVQTEWNLRKSYFWNITNPRNLECTSEDPRGGHKIGGAHPPGHALHPREPLVAPLTYFFRLYIFIYPKNIREHNRSGVPPPETSVATENQSRPVPAPCRRGQSFSGGHLHHPGALHDE